MKCSRSGYGEEQQGSAGRGAARQYKAMGSKAGQEEEHKAVQGKAG